MKDAKLMIKVRDNLGKKKIGLWINLQCSCLFPLEEISLEVPPGLISCQKSTNLPHVSMNILKSMVTFTKSCIKAFSTWSCQVLQDTQGLVKGQTVFKKLGCFCRSCSNWRSSAFLTNADSMANLFWGWTPELCLFATGIKIRFWLFSVDRDYVALIQDL